jgi:endonuclease/exonuclease/phosphatase family metal-dependent hydrolase
MRMAFPRWNSGVVLAWIVLSLASGLVQAADAPPLRVRVLTYNIHHAEGVDGKLDLERIAKVINAVEPDVVSVQEVDQKVERSRKVDQPAELMRLTKLQGAFGGNLKFQGGDYGNLVLSRWPIVKQRNHKLPALSEGEPRGVLETEIELPNRAGQLTFLATHFDHRSDERERIVAAKFVNELETQPLALLAGDLNATPDSKPLEILTTVWKVANPKPLPTIPVAKPTRQIDFVLAKPAAHWKTIETRVLDEAVASDHRALLAVLEMVPSED